MPGMKNPNNEGQLRVAYGALGTTAIVGLMGLLILLLLGACSGRAGPEATPDHTHTPDTVPHTHAPPGSVGEALEEKLQEALPPQSPGGHQGSEGLTLGSESGQETVYAGALCDSAAKVREYDVLAINAEITLNRFLGYDP